MDSLQVFRNSVAGIPYKINDNIQINHPTLAQICDMGERDYYSMISMITANTSDYKVLLWDMDIDWTTITDYDLFAGLIYKQLSIEHTKIILGDLNLSELEPMHNLQTGENVLAKKDENGNNQVIIDRALYTEMVNYIRDMHGYENKVDRPADLVTKKYMINKARKKIARQQKREYKSSLKPLISSLVNHYSFKYDYSKVWDITVSALTESVSRIQKFMNYTYKMQGIYAGTVDLKKGFNPEELNWMN